MTNGNPPRRPPTPPPLDQVRPIEERYAPPPGQRTAPRPPPHPTHPAQQHQPVQHTPPPPPGQGQVPPGRGPYAYPQQQQPPQYRRPPQHTGPGRPGGTAPRSARRGPGIGSLLLVLFIGVGLVAAAGAAFVLLAPPTDLIREQAITLIKERTGRDLVIRGPARFTIYPSLGVTLKDVSLSAPPGMDAPPTVAMESIDVSVRLVPLLSRRVEVRRLVLTRPVFDLRVDKSGRRSWDFASADAGSQLVRFAAASPRDTPAGTVLTDASSASHPIVLAQRAATSAAPTSAPGGDRLAAVKDLVLQDVRIVGGKLTYADARSGIAESLDAINVALKARTLSKPLTARGDLAWKGQTIRFDGTLTTLYEILAQAPAKLAVDISADPIKANYSGAIDVKSGATLDGTVSAETRSLRALALWLGGKLPENNGFGQLNVNGRLKTRPGAFQLTNADITLDGMHVTGDLDGTTTGSRPYVKADLKVSELNLNTYVETSGHTGRARAPTARVPVEQETLPPAERQGSQTPAPNATAPAGRAPQSIEDLLERQDSGPRVKGYTARAGWSDEPIEVELLGLVDADAKLSVGRLIVRDIKVDQSDLTLALKDRVAKIIFDRVDLYGGSGRGQIDIDGAAAAPGIAASIVVDGVSAEPLLKDAAAIDWLSGKGKLTLATTSRGVSQRQLVSALDGKASFVFTDGAIKGFNVAKALRGLQSGQFSNLSASSSESTDFSQLSASFDIASGVATNQDLQMMSPLLRVTGAGKVMLPDRHVDYTVNPKLVADLSGQGGNTGLAGLQVPVRIVGPWHKPDIAPDLSKVDAKQAVQAVEEIGKRLKGKDAGEVVDELFGKDSKESQKAKKFLDKLFR